MMLKRKRSHCRLAEMVTNLSCKSCCTTCHRIAGHYPGDATSLGEETPPRTDSSNDDDVGRWLLPASSPPRAPPSQVVVVDLLPFQRVWCVLLSSRLHHLLPAWVLACLLFSSHSSPSPPTLTSSPSRYIIVILSDHSNPQKCRLSVLCF